MMKKIDFDLRDEGDGQGRRQPRPTGDPLAPRAYPDDWSDPLNPSKLISAYRNATRSRPRPYWAPVVIAGVLLLLVFSIWCYRGAHPTREQRTSVTQTAQENPPGPTTRPPGSLAAQNP